LTDFLIKRWPLLAFGLLSLGLLLSTTYLSGELDTERERHKATAMELKGKLALADTEISLLRRDQAEQGRIIAGLQVQVSQARGTLEQERQAAAERAAITAGAKSRPARPEEVVDAETSRKIIRHFNAALQRR
jgi:hypothetical protein